MTSPFLNLPLRTPETILHTRRRAVELARARGWEWEKLTPPQQGGMLAHAERELTTRATGEQNAGRS